LNKYKKHALKNILLYPNGWDKKFVTHPYWQAKIWGLMHDPALKSLRTRYSLNDEGPWESLSCMKNWVSPKEPKNWKSSTLNGTWLKNINLCDLISSSSDRSTIARIPPDYSAVIYENTGLEIRHLISGEIQQLKLQPSLHTSIHQKGRNQWIKQKEVNVIPDSIKNCDDPRKVFWWLWRCYPEAISKGSPEIALLPGDTRIPDASLWSHTSMTASLAGALAGYHRDESDYPEKGKRFKRSRPHLATFTFTPVQEFIKASRKMRDFWAGSWLLHYLSAKVCWDIAWKYGPDTLIYPCLYAQPLIDHWLLKKYEDFNEWIEPPEKSIETLLTAGFPNVIFTVLPDNAVEKDNPTKNPIYATMQMSQQTLRSEWEGIGKKVLNWLQSSPKSEWNNIYPKLWNEWIENQWQTYWVALPLGDRNTELHKSPRKPKPFTDWKVSQNTFAQPEQKLFDPSEDTFFKAIWGINSPIQI
jgi:CRISPR-associated protein Cmr2